MFPVSRFVIPSLAAALLATAPASAQSLKIGLASDPNILDPVLDRTLDGRTVFQAMCDKLVDLSADMKIVPQLATSWSWNEAGTELTFKLRDGVLFQDGEKFDAAAVKYNLERDLTLPGSNRKGELPPFKVTVVDPLTVKMELEKPFAPLLVVLADRAGMMVSPKAAEALGKDFGNHPVCAGAFKFVERVTQDRIVLERFDRYWNKDHIKLDRLTYLPLPDGSVRLANVRAGDLDLIEGVLPTDMATVEADPKLGHASAEELGYIGLTLNVGNGPRAKGPLGSDPRVRRALELSLDRDAINQVISNGLDRPDNQFMAPVSPYHVADLPVPPRDVAKAKALLAEAGAPHPSFTLLIGVSPAAAQTGQIIQAMAAEAGFDIKLQATDFGTALDAAKRGDFDAIIGGWSGRIDPDGNSYIFLHSGGPLNDSHYLNPEVDQLLDQARALVADEARKPLYAKVQALESQDLPIIYLYHPEYLWAFGKQVKGFAPAPDGVIRVTDLTKG
ncbi:MAG TPA: ABC transporter substrate-binding protein [Aliidongia sp.]|nr:ABC transporter substrate-binding protein [Aliidongia sp.]